MCALLVYLVLVVVTQAAEDCMDICKLSLSRKVDGTRFSGCNCFLKGNRQYFAHLPEMLSKNSGIYFEPAEKYPRRHLSFGEHPFYISNPTFKINLDNTKFVKMIKSRPAEPFQEEYEVDDNIYKKYKRHGNSFNSETPESSGLPLYLDLDIKYRTDSRRTSTKESTKTVDIISIKQNLQECMNLHVFINSRKSNEVNKLKGIWGVTKLEKYVILSDSEILSKIRNVCRDSANIMEQSLKEIRERLPKKNNSIALNADDINITSQVRTEVTTAKTSRLSKSTISTSSVIPNVANTESLNLGKTTAHANLKPLEGDAANISLRSAKKSIKSFRLEKFSDNNIVDVQFVTNTQTTNNLSHGDTKQSYLITTEVETTTKGDSMSPHFNTVTEQDTARPANDFACSRNSPLDNFVSSTETYSNRVIYALYDHNDYNKNKNELFTNVGSTTTTYYEITETSNSEITPDDNLLRYQHIPPQNDKDLKSFLEPEIQIPKLVTREFPNNTVVSFLNGTEEIPNGDFENVSAALPKIEITEHRGMGKGNFFSEAANTITKVQHKKESINTNYSKSSEINGSLYFLFGKDAIPARFAQTSDGKINIGIDGIVLCDKISTLENASILLKVLCRCIQLDNCKDIVNR